MNELLPSVLWVIGMFFAGVFLYSIGIMQIMLVLSCAIPVTRKMSKETPMDTKKIYAKCAFTVFLWGALSAGCFFLAETYAAQAGQVGFYVGIGISFLVSLGQLGPNDNNLKDYFSAYGKYIHLEEDFKEPGKPKDIGTILVLLFLCAAVVGVILFVYLSENQNSALEERIEQLEIQIEDKNKTIESLRKKNNDLSAKVNKYEDAYNFYYNYAVLVTESGEKYHRYDCQYVQGRSFWIYNIDAAKGMGYEPCSACFGG